MKEKILIVRKPQNFTKKNIEFFGHGFLKSKTKKAKTVDRGVWYLNIYYSYAILSNKTFFSSKKELEKISLGERARPRLAIRPSSWRTITSTSDSEISHAIPSPACT